MVDELFWADAEALEVIKSRGKKSSYVCSAGITPSGPKHIGNFREIITVDMIVKALRDSGKNVKFLYVWDSYDRFRKVPADVPNNKFELMKNEIGKPVCDVIDPWGCHSSWAEHWMTKLEHEIALTGIKPDYIRQHDLYRQGVYANSIKQALVKRDVIINNLNKYRKEPLDANWYPIIVYCERCSKDLPQITSYDGKYSLSYKCPCGHSNTIDFRKKGIVKLRWRVDWPMRWAYYGVDFEPAGKDHMVEGSSRTTGELVVKDVYNKEPPYAFMYGLVRSKGGEGKMSASHGNVIFVSDALAVYFAPVMRYIFMGNRANKDFAISFDEDVIKIYEDFYQCERAYYGKTDLADKRVNQLKRVYEFCVEKPAKKMPVQLSFRTAALVIQTADKSEWLAKIKEFYKITKTDEPRVKSVLNCAEHWIKYYAPEEYKIIINDKAPKIKLSPTIKKAVIELGKKLLDKKRSEDELTKIIFDIAKPVGIKEFFTACYQLILSKDKGPKLAPFIISADQKRIGELLVSA
ncbi:MAG: lysine--tRNA ligase [Candidatus Nanoarchaeia archaeon]|jgi:lysyl-tRNA synthetase class 1